MATLTYTIDGSKTSAISFFETLRILTQYKSKKVNDYSDLELSIGVAISGYEFKILNN